MCFAGEELYWLEQEAMLFRRPQKAAGYLVDEDRLVVGVIEPEEPRAEHEATMRRTDCTVRREAEMQFQRHRHVGVEADLAPAAGERDFIERHVVDVEMERALGGRGAVGLHCRRPAAVRAIGGNVERRRAFGLIEGELEPAEDGAALFLLVVDDELAARDSDTIDRADWAVGPSDRIEQ